MDRDPPVWMKIGAVSASQSPQDSRRLRPSSAQPCSTAFTPAWRATADVVYKAVNCQATGGIAEAAIKNALTGGC